MSEQNLNVAEIPIVHKNFEKRINADDLELREEVVSLNRVAKVVKGGRRFSFNALVVIGDLAGHVGVGFGKANEVPDAIHKGVQSAKKAIISVPLLGRTIPHQTIGEFGAAKVLLKPASEGTGIIAGPAARAILELAGVKDVLTKCLGSNNVLNVVKATLMGLATLKDASEIARLRGKSVEELFGKKVAEIYKKSKIELATAHDKKDDILHPITNLTIQFSDAEEDDFEEEAIPPVYPAEPEAEDASNNPEPNKE